MTVDFEACRRERDNDPNRVRCAHYGAWILGIETRCPKCGIHFRGQAFQFAHEATDELSAARINWRRRAVIVAVALVVALVIGTFLFFAHG
jgi:uncharacterized membrane protein YvbJ